VTAHAPEPAPATLPPAWAGLVDDAAIFPPGDLPLAEAREAHPGHRRTGLVGTFVVRDTDLPALAGFAHPLSVVVTGGAGQLAGPLALAARTGLSVAGVEIALRDLDDLAGNARRVVAAVDAARSEGVLDDETPVHVELPGRVGAGWLRAADEVASAELRLKLRTGAPDGSLPADEADLAERIDAALDRETPFKCTAGLHRAVRHDDQHGFVNVLLATRRAFDGASREEVVATLAERDADAVAAAVRAEEALAGARRWFTSFGSCSVDEPLADLRAMGLLA
jgi:hypothetical protein